MLLSVWRLRWFKKKNIYIYDRARSPLGQGHTSSGRRYVNVTNVTASHRVSGHFSPLLVVRTGLMTLPMPSVVSNVEQIFCHVGSKTVNKNPLSSTHFFHLVSVCLCPTRCVDLFKDSLDNFMSPMNLFFFIESSLA